MVNLTGLPDDQIVNPTHGVTYSGTAETSSKNKPRNEITNHEVVERDSKAACAIKEGGAIFRSEQCDRMTLASGLVNKIAGSGGLSLRKKGGKNSGDKLTRTPFQRPWEA